jgi:hypothetical protein
MKVQFSLWKKTCGIDEVEDEVQEKKTPPDLNF